jgi:hypothetical protein
MWVQELGAKLLIKAKNATQSVFWHSGMIPARLAQPIVVAFPE